MQKKAGYFVLVLLVLLFAWDIIARSGVAGLTVPTVASVAQIYLQPRFAALLYRSALATGCSALLGLGIGVILGTSVAVAAHCLPLLQPGLDRLAVTVNAVPAVAIAPIFVLLVSREFTPTLLSAIAVFFLTYVAVSSGLHAPSSKLLDMLSTLGAGKWQRLRYVELPAALPEFLAGIKVSVTAAMIGAVVGEWFGAPSGLGIVILNTMQNFQVPLMWAAVLAVAAISLTGYGCAHAALRLLGRRY